MLPLSPSENEREQVDSGRLPLRACVNDVPKIKIGKNQNRKKSKSKLGSDWSRFETSRLRQFIFRESLPNQRSPQGLKVAVNTVRILSKSCMFF